MTAADPGRDPWSVRAHVPAFDAWVARYRAESALALADPALDWRALPCGPDPAQEVLVARPRGAGALPFHAFVHGGYWRAFEPRDYAFVARAVCGAGAACVLPGYRKMPRHRLGQLVADVRAAVARATGGAPFTASGHSAGAHLAAFLPAERLLLVSGVFDPAPLRDSAMQAEIGLEEEDLAWVPGPPRPAALLVGARETAPFHGQARVLAARWGAPLRVVDEDHMSIVHALAREGSEANAALRDAIRGPAP